MVSQFHNLVFPRSIDFFRLSRLNQHQFQCRQMLFALFRHDHPHFRFQNALKARPPWKQINQKVRYTRTISSSKYCRFEKTGSCIPDESMPTLLSTPLTIETTPTETGYATTEQSEYEQTEKASNIDSEQLQEIMDTLRMNKIELNRNSRMFDELKARIRIMEEEAESDPYQHSYEFAITIVRVKCKINDLEVLTDRLQY